ncbi:MAG: ADP-heptose:LPS heptosyltransferase [Verrucomicrobiales bacterium]|nr:ADP-heptose:LPS heptosyltransferase [Verrucomicrobiales bacterium]
MNVLIYRIGQLGDTLVALPAIRAVRQHYPRAKIGLLCDSHPEKSYVLSADLLRPSGLVDHFETYPILSGRCQGLLKPFHALSLLVRLRSRTYDILVYLAPSDRSPEQVRRDKLFFQAAGIKEFVGMTGFVANPNPENVIPLPRVMHEADQLMSRLALSGVSVPPPGQGCMDLNFTEDEEAEFGSWVKSLPTSNQRVWVGFGPGSKMPAKKWSITRYEEVGHELIRQYDIWPVIFGGTEDIEVGNQLLEAWGRGYNAAGKLGLRAAGYALKQCALYLGNDTGTMHLAAAAGTRCVAIFSARDWPGKWDPYGFGHKVLRTSLECEGCRLTACVERKNECLNRVFPKDVIAGARAILAEDRSGIAVHS